MKKNLGIVGLLAAICLITWLCSPSFAEPYNLQNLARRTALFGILSIGVSFVIITGGIDLSIGSLVGLTGCVLAWLLTQKGLAAPVAVALVLLLSGAIGLFHGLLITRVRLQPFVVTLCGLLLYRGAARWLTDDLTIGFGSGHEGLRALATSRPCSIATLAIGVGSVWTAGAAAIALAARAGRERGGQRSDFLWIAIAMLCAAAGLAVQALELEPLASIRVPAPFLVMLALALAASVLLNRTVFGRYLFALGRNELAARYSGIDTHRMIVRAYVLCALIAGAGSVLFALDINSIQPAMHGNFYELYAIAAAVLGGCSLRGGEGSVFGVVIGAAVMQVLYNSINPLGIPTNLEFAIIGAVILAGVVADELIRRLVAHRRALRSARE